MSNGYSTVKTVALWLAYISFIFFVAVMAALHQRSPVGLAAWAILGLSFIFIMIGQRPEALGLQHYLDAPRAPLYTVIGMAVVAAVLAAAGIAA